MLLGRLWCREKGPSIAVLAEGHIPSQFGRSAVVTGATGGLGYEMALALARAGAEVILTGRDDRKGLSAIEKIHREVSCARISYESLDLSNLASIADFSQRTKPRHSLDLLINNAGVMRCRAGKSLRTASRCNLEQTIWVTLFSRLA